MSEHVLFKSDKGTADTLKQLNYIMVRSLAMVITPLFIVVSGFASTNYWSSTEASATNARNQNFNNGNQNSNNKNNSLRVRCSRGFKQNR